MTKQASPHAAAAKLIREEMKLSGIQCKVRAQRYSGGSSVYVDVFNQPREYIGKIEAFLRKYEKGTFDGMTDSYEYNNTRDDLPQVSFVIVQNRTLA